MVPMKILSPYCEQIIQSIANHLNSRLNSTSATNEGILVCGLVIQAESNSCLTHGIYR